MPNNHTEFAGVLLDPDGVTEDVQTNQISYNSSQLSRTMQFFRRDPERGHWRLVLLSGSNSVAGQFSVEFHGSIGFDDVRLQTKYVPHLRNTRLRDGYPWFAWITVTNTGNTTKSFFVDARRTGSVTVHPPGPRYIHLLGNGYPSFVVPPETSHVDVLTEAVRPSVPIVSEMVSELTPGRCRQTVL